jgi:hypothetical protein
MKNVIALLALIAFSSTVTAKQKITPLDEATAAQLQGKTLVVTTHKVPSFTAATAGKAGLLGGLLGAAAMISAGNKMVKDHSIQDPAIIVRDEVSRAIAAKYGMTITPSDSKIIEVGKVDKIAAIYPDANYILDVQTGMWAHWYYPTKWGTYWLMYTAQVRLIDVNKKTVVSSMFCNVDTKKNENAPSREQLLENNAALMKDTFSMLGWNCASMASKQVFLLKDNEINPTPAQFVDPLKDYAARKSGAATNSAAAVVPPTSTEQATTPASDPNLTAPAPEENTAEQAAPVVTPTEQPVETVAEPAEAEAEAEATKQEENKETADKE